MNRLWVRLTFGFIAVTLIVVVAIGWLADSSANNEFQDYLLRQEQIAQTGLIDDLAVLYQRNSNWNGVSELIAAYNAPMGRGRGAGTGMMGRNRPPILFADANGNVIYDERKRKTHPQSIHRLPFFSLIAGASFIR